MLPKGSTSLIGSTFYYLAVQAPSKIGRGSWMPWLVAGLGGGEQSQNHTIPASHQVSPLETSFSLSGKTGPCHPLQGVQPSKRFRREQGVP